MVPYDIPQVAVDQLPDGVHLLDVRELDEWEDGHIEGAQHVPMSELIQRLDEVPTDRDMVVVCAVGSRSAQVTAYLAQRGYRVANLAGGMHAWLAAGRPVV
jgi:rhodanese-related sulfurtransferase